VINARVHAQKVTGGRVELLVERLVAPDEAWVQLSASHPAQSGSNLVLPGGAHARVVTREGRFYLLRFFGTGELSDWLERHGEVPLPPYVDRDASDTDATRYQTVYAREPGAVAAPTAGLHFDAAMLRTLNAQGVAHAFVTLHIGAGTFVPVAAQDLSQHRMHSERYRVPMETVSAVAATRARGGRVLAVGTTTLRALESAVDAAGDIRAGESETALFVTPGYQFRAVDRLLTNFHLPQSTLLILAAAFGGYHAVRAAYAHAITAKYRFYSYGDAMLLERALAPAST